VVARLAGVQLARGGIDGPKGGAVVEYLGLALYFGGWGVAILAVFAFKAFVFVIVPYWVIRSLMSDWVALNKPKDGDKG